MPMTTRMVMMAETRKVSLRGALKLKFMMPPNDNASGLPIPAGDFAILAATPGKGYGGVATGLFVRAAGSRTGNNEGLAVDEDAGGARGDRAAAAGLVALNRSRLAVDEHVGRAFDDGS